MTLVIGPIKEQLPFLIQTAELIANTNQSLICPFTGFVDSIEVVVNKAVTTGGTITLAGGGAVFNLQNYLDITSFPGAAQGDTPYLPGPQTFSGLALTASAPSAPGYFQSPSHGLSPGQPIQVGGTLPTGLTSGNTYYVSAYGFTKDAFNLATSVANALSGVSATLSGSTSAAAGYSTGKQGIVPITNCLLTVANSAPVGTMLSASVPNGDPTNLVVAGQLLTIALAGFATAGEVNGLIAFRSNR